MPQKTSPGYTGPDRRTMIAPRRVAFDPTVNLGHLLTFAGFLVTIFLSWSNLDKRVTLTEAELLANKQFARELDARYRDTLSEVRSDMKEMRRTLEDLARNTAVARSR